LAFFEYGHKNIRLLILTWSNNAKFYIEK
jgi:hypothetical protein